MTTTDHEQIHEAVKERYAAAAQGAQAAQATCCGATSEAEAELFGAVLYDESETAALPNTAVVASLGCGNPTLLANLRPGEVVLDLGSGGGIDVLLSARRVAPKGKAYGLDMTPEMLELARRNQAEAGVTNAEVLLGTIEEVPLPDASVDVIISPTAWLTSHPTRTPSSPRSSGCCCPVEGWRSPTSWSARPCPSGFGPSWGSGPDASPAPWSTPSTRPSWRSEAGTERIVLPLVKRSWWRSSSRTDPDSSGELANIDTSASRSLAAASPALMMSAWRPGAMYAPCNALTAKQRVLPACRPLHTLVMRASERTSSSPTRRDANRATSFRAAATSWRVIWATLSSPSPVPVPPMPR